MFWKCLGLQDPEITKAHLPNVVELLLKWSLSKQDYSLPTIDGVPVLQLIENVLLSEPSLYQDKIGESGRHFSKIVQLFGKNDAGSPEFWKLIIEQNLQPALLNFEQN